MDKKLNVTNQNVKLALSKAKELLRNTNSIKNKNIDIINFKDDIQTWKDQDTGLIWEIKSSNNIDEIYTYEKPDIVVNATSVGMGEGIWESPVKDSTFFEGVEAVFDVIYIPWETKLLTLPLGRVYHRTTPFYLVLGIRKWFDRQSLSHSVHTCSTAIEPNPPYRLHKYVEHSVRPYMRHLPLDHSVL